MNPEQWSDLDDSWPRYQDAVQGWLEIARRPDADAAEVDELTHALIAAHNEWSSRLGAILEATHHH